MKRVTALLFLLVAPLLLFSQTSFYDGDFKIKGSRDSKEVPIRVGENDIYLSFLCKYDIYKNEPTLQLIIDIPTIQVSTFKTQIRELEGKYNEWANVARTNNVKNVNKEIPVALSAICDNLKICEYTEVYKNYRGERLFNAQETSVTPKFVVKDGIPHCYIWMFAWRNGEQVSTIWSIGEYDFSKITEGVDKAIKIQNERKEEKERVKDLFH